MAAVTICSDFGAPPKIKSFTVSIVSPSICCELYSLQSWIGSRLIFLKNKLWAGDQWTAGFLGLLLGSPEGRKGAGKQGGVKHPHQPAPSPQSQRTVSPDHSGASCRWNDPSELQMSWEDCGVLAPLGSVIAWGHPGKEVWLSFFSRNKSWSSVTSDSCLPTGLPKAGI